MTTGSGRAGNHTTLESQKVVVREFRRLAPWCVLSFPLRQALLRAGPTFLISRFDVSVAVSSLWGYAAAGYLVVSRGYCYGIVAYSIHRSYSPLASEGFSATPFMYTDLGKAIFVVIRVCVIRPAGLSCVYVVSCILTVVRQRSTSYNICG